MALTFNASTALMTATKHKRPKLPFQRRNLEVKRRTQKPRRTEANGAIGTSRKRRAGGAMPAGGAGVVQGCLIQGVAVRLRIASSGYGRSQEGVRHGARDELECAGTSQCEEDAVASPLRYPQLSLAVGRPIGVTVTAQLAGGETWYPQARSRIS